LTLDYQPFEAPLIILVPDIETGTEIKPSQLTETETGKELHKEKRTGMELE